MDLHVMLLRLAVRGVILAAIIARVATAQGMPGCKDRCGNLKIPYPFGMSQGCYLNDSFLITCTYSKTYLNGNLSVLNIALEGQLRILSPIATVCGSSQGNTTKYQPLSTSFPISTTRNKFIAVGCNTTGAIRVFLGKTYTATSCKSFYNTTNKLINGSCSGTGCCQTFIPKGLRDFKIVVENYFGNVYLRNPSFCSHAFVVEQGYYDFSSLDLYSDSPNLNPFPVVLDWAVGETKCEQAKKNKTGYLCQENSECYDWDGGAGYHCRCSKGYQGNPYLPNGCKDVNECDDDQGHNDCTHICRNTAGRYVCLCPKGYHGDGRKGGQGCLQTKATVGMSMSLVFMFVIVSVLYWGVRKKKIMKRRETFFKQNGGIMLQQLLSNCKRKGSAQGAKIFTEDELKRATNNFGDGNVIGQGGYGTVYAGTLKDDMIVAIKKSKVVDRGQIEQFINEVVILSQIKHPNVVNLLGCCLETPVPLLVYEFITNNTLFHHIHDEGRVSSMPWELRLRIAVETAGALAHMHSFPINIIHRDVKSANILLDDQYTAKVSDFGVSRLVPLDQTQLPTLVQGTFGYLDPEYFYSGLLTKKSDVYSFGVVLVELLTGKNVFSLDRPEEDRGLAMYFISSLKEGHLLQILEDRVKKEGHAEQLKGVTEVAKKCLRLKGRKRPTMKEVKEELEALRNSKLNHGSELDHTYKK
ncbi:wall-associated receptor kinase 2-like [Cornus florida]|uniref:wall-associated receptor kinase 2-like n=1 Tax=Cornus florida TaxID=4283 RepID=UPI0028981090|nr:wall-associated receptor kinase 2-like [Cornus florida]